MVEFEVKVMRGSKGTILMEETISAPEGDVYEIHMKKGERCNSVFLLDNSLVFSGVKACQEMILSETFTYSEELTPDVEEFWNQITQGVK